MCVDTVSGKNKSQNLREGTPIKTADSDDETIVLKFGSSVLGDASDLKNAVTEVYRYARHGRKVVAVVSAFEGETDALIAEAASLGAKASSRHAPRLIALGEERAAALLAIACDASGLDARLVGAREIGLRASGDTVDAHPEGVDKEALETILSQHEVIIVPGFIAIGASGEQVLLGRGGSDLTAVYLGGALGLDEVTLIKDVDGVYDRDPAEAGDAAQRYETLSYDRARLVAGKLLQSKAIDFAAKHGVAIRVASSGSARATRVGIAGASEPTPAAQTENAFSVAVAGLGVIGEGAALRMVEATDYDFAGALVRDASKPRNEAFAGKVFDDPSALLATEPAALIDALSEGPAGKELIEAALKKGVSVVTANKQAVAGSLQDLQALAKSHDAILEYSSSVGGGSPMVETMRQAVKTGVVKEITGILNGTVNFLIDAMKKGASFDEAVKQAQIAGFAEADPSADLSGLDAKAKISILSYEAFGEEPDQDEIAVEGLDQGLAEKFAKDASDWRQVARVEKKDGKILARVAYEPVDGDALFADSVGEENVMRVITEGGEFTCRGRGAGRLPTVESILGDLGAVRRAKTSA